MSDNPGMARFLLVVRGGALVNPSVLPHQRSAHRDTWRAWLNGLSAADHLELGGHPIDSTGRTVRGRAKALVVGPHAEGNDMVTGTLLMLAANLAGC
jgi:hypothetical protein